MGRATDQDVHSAYVEYRASPDDKCLSVQCIYCHQIRAKNTSRQKQHLLECPGLRNHPSAQPNQTPTQPTAPRPPSSSDDVPGYGPPFSLEGAASALNGAAAVMNGTPLQNRPSLPESNTNGSSVTPAPRPLNKPKPTPKQVPGSNIPAPPLEDVHSAFVEFRANESDKCLSVQCIYCNQIRAKNTSRQRQHLLECPTYLNVMKDSIPANNLLHRFDEGDIARSLSLPTPSLDLDFRMSIKLNPKVNVGTSPGSGGQRNWISFIGGQWAGRWGKGIVIPGGQDTQTTYKDLTTSVESRFLIQTNDDPPAMIIVKTKGWWTGPRDVMEKLHNDPEEADTVPASQYKLRANIELETGDERYGFLSSGMWLGSGSRRANEIVLDAYRVG